MAILPGKLKIRMWLHASGWVDFRCRYFLIYKSHMKLKSVSCISTEPSGKPMSSNRWFNKKETMKTKNSVYETCPGGSDGKESACDVGDLGSTPGSGRSPGDANDNPLQYSGLENPMGRGAWQATVYGVAKNRTRLSDQACTRRH